MLIHSLVDEEFLNHYTRKLGNVKVFVDNNGIYKKNIERVFKPIKIDNSKINVRERSRSVLQPNWKNGSLLVQAYALKDEYKTSKAYAIGFYIKDLTNLFYIQEVLNSDKLIMKCLNAMLVYKYNGYTFYVHNFGKYDVFFFLGVIIKANTLQPDVYDYSLSFNNKKILTLTISKNVKFIKGDGKQFVKRYNIKIVNLYNILFASLRKLCKTFNSEVNKSYFPYNIVNSNKLFYRGDKPDIDYYVKNKYMVKTTDVL